ncbi:MAG: 5-(carboxyamino)imidazole ribonucleotide synthase [Ginsengibacter sp.]
MKKVGILGGGQLGRMLLQAAANYPVHTSILENHENCPAGHLAHHFVKGDFRNYDDVYSFGKGLDAITIEIETVNVEALEKLQDEGVKIYPKPSALKIIRDKIVQKNFYKDNNIPTSDFVITNNRSAIAQHESFLPAIHKIGQGGYDGKGVISIKTVKDIDNAFDHPAVLEKQVQIKKEIALIIAVANNGETVFYPPVEMVFDPVLNLLDYQLSPAELDEKILWKVEAVAMAVVNQLRSPGIFAVEMFIDENENVLVNETAPRVHNSGHHTIEANFSSQFDMLWRVILEYPLGNTDCILPSAIVNIIGADGFSGKALYEGIEKVLSLDNVFLHIYGKPETKAGRKMGHATILSSDRQELEHTAKKIKNMLKVTSGKKDI